MAETNVPGTGVEVEVPPKGVRIRTREEKELKDGDVVYLFTKGIGEIAAVEKPFKLERQAGGLVLKPVEDDRGPKEVRHSLAKEIAGAIAPQLKEQVTAMVEDALKTKSVQRLEKLRDEAKAGKKLGLKRTRGCVFLEIGDVQTVL